MPVVIVSDAVVGVQPDVVPALTTDAPVPPAEAVSGGENVVANEIAQVTCPGAAPENFAGLMPVADAGAATTGAPTSVPTTTNATALERRNGM